MRAFQLAYFCAATWPTFAPPLTLPDAVATSFSHVVQLRTTLVVTPGVESRVRAAEGGQGVRVRSRDFR